MSSLPKDPIMLLSIINTKLRDHYNDLENFCDIENHDIEHVTERLRAVGYSYNNSLNQFKKEI